MQGIEINGPGRDDRFLSSFQDLGVEVAFVPALKRWAMIGVKGKLKRLGRTLLLADDFRQGSFTSANVPG
jgi:hypothetical protein